MGKCISKPRYISQKGTPYFCSFCDKYLGQDLHSCRDTYVPPGTRSYWYCSDECYKHKKNQVKSNNF
jgi:hypothetical protein